LTTYHLVLFFINFTDPIVVNGLNIKCFGNCVPTNRKVQEIQLNRGIQQEMVQNKKIEVEDEKERTSQDNASTPLDPKDGAGEAVEADLSTAALEEMLTAAKAEASESQDRMLRMAAELDNYRKRAARELDDLKKYATENLIRQLLVVVDNLERAIDSATSGNGNEQGLVDGVALTLAEINKILEKHYVSPIQAIGEPFDPAYHQAMCQEESTDQPPNTVVQEFQKGYLIHDRLLRPAMVVVSKAAQNGQASDQSVNTNA
jgi:molecular chaperone GrpE